MNTSQSRIGYKYRKSKACPNHYNSPQLDTGHTNMLTLSLVMLFRTYTIETINMKCHAMQSILYIQQWCESRCMPIICYTNTHAPIQCHTIPTTIIRWVAIGTHIIEVHVYDAAGICTPLGHQHHHRRGLVGVGGLAELPWSDDT